MLHQLMNGVPLVTFLWKNKYALALITFIGVAIIAYFLNDDYNYIVKTGLSLLHRGDASSLERFLYLYEASGGFVVIVLSAMGFLVPTLSILPLLAASRELYGFYVGTLYVWLGISVGLVLFALMIRSVFSRKFARKKNV